MKSPKKLIEVALPLKAINEAAAREKSIRHGHPSTLHLWWARRPLAAARAVLFAQMVNDPGGERGWDSRKGITKEKARQERERLFKIIEDLVKWENTDNEEVLAAARREIMRSWRETCEANGKLTMENGKCVVPPLPAFHDPFAGGGAIPLEAQRLGLEAYASDLNPVAVAINKAMIEIPPRFAGREPVGPEEGAVKSGQQELPGLTEGLAGLAGRARLATACGTCGTCGSQLSRQSQLSHSPPVAPVTPVTPVLPSWPRASALAEDVRRYGAWMREEARKRIGHLYPNVRITKEMAKARPDLKPYVGRELTVIAWLWARTVKSPHPAFADCDVPLVSSFVLSSKPGKEAWVEVVASGKEWHFEVRTGKPPKGADKGTKGDGRNANFKCVLSGAIMEGEYIKSEGRAGRIGDRLMTVVLEGDRSRVYIEPQIGMEDLARSANPKWYPSGKVPRHLTGGTCVPYGLDEWKKLFTDRQLVAINTFLDLVQEARAKVLADAKAAFWADDGIRLADGGSGPTAYADAVAVYLTFAVDKSANYWTSICTWHITRSGIKSMYGRQAIPMAWDFAECNPFSDSSGNWMSHLELTAEGLESFPASVSGFAFQADAQTQSISREKIVSTDPPYYDNIAYADLSDFFYVLMRKGLRKVFPELCSTIETPKDDELVAAPYRRGGTEKAEAFFMDGMTATMKNLAEHAHPAFPVTIYYAYKQSETDEGGTGNAGWETFLEAVIRAGFQITGTWPMRTELVTGLKTYTNALASSVVLVCRKRPADAPVCERRDFLRELRARMPEAIEELVGRDENASPVSPVDLPQAVIGPGMELFSKYSEVLNADGTRMGVRDAIREINNFVIDPGFDPETQFCLDWFKAAGWNERSSGDAITMAQAKGLAVADIVEAGVLESRGGRTRLIHWRDYPEGYDPSRDHHRPAWEVCHHLVRVHQKKGNGAAGDFLALVQEQGEAARSLAYQLYTLCERKGLAEEARPYNELVAAWDDILTASNRAAAATQQQLELGI